MIDDIDPKRQKGSKMYSGFIGDYLVEFLGGLIPGILFSIALIFVFGPPLHLFMSSIANKAEILSFPATIAKTIRLTRGTPYMVWFGTFVFGLILSYVAGYLFYRRDPKVPNKKGFVRISKKHPTKSELEDAFPKLKKENYPKIKKDKDWEENKYAIWKKKLENEWKRRNYGCANEDECEFPFPFLHKYLKQRGHKHLLSLINWKEEKAFRSKTFINSQKIRLQYFSPYQYQQVIRNEAHVRLTTSTWYMSNALMKYSYAGVMICVLGVLILLARMSFSTYIPFDSFGVGFANWLITPFLSPLFIWILAFYCRWTNETFIHYQRLREAFYVLELSYIVARKNPDFLDYGIMEKTILEHQS